MVVMLLNSHQALVEYTCQQGRSEQGHFCWQPGRTGLQQWLLGLPRTLQLQDNERKYLHNQSTVEFTVYCITSNTIIDIYSTHTVM